MTSPSASFLVAGALDLRLLVNHRHVEPMRWAWAMMYEHTDVSHIPQAPIHTHRTDASTVDDTRFETLQRPYQIFNRPPRYGTKCTPIDMATQAAGRPISVTSSRNSTCSARCLLSSFGPGTDRSIRRELKSNRSRFDSVADMRMGVQ